MAKSELIRLQTERLQDEICRNLELLDLQWDGGTWDIAYKRGVLVAFKDLIEHHAIIKEVLKSRFMIIEIPDSLIIL